MSYFKPKWNPVTTKQPSLALTDDNDDNAVTNPEIQAAQIELIEKDIEVVNIAEGLVRFRFFSFITWLSDARRRS